MDDNKELVEVMLTSYNKYADKIGAPHGYIACMEAALSIIQPELDKRDEVIERYKSALEDIADRKDKTMLADPDLLEIEQRQYEIGVNRGYAECAHTAETALKTTTGHDINNHKPQGE